jgi:membrane protein implicated in regulation of membrane protease activity
MKNFFSNRYYHLVLALIAIVAGVKIWMQPSGNMKMQIFISVIIVLVIARSIYRFLNLK